MNLYPYFHHLLASWQFLFATLVIYDVEAVDFHGI